MNRGVRLLLRSAWLGQRWVAGLVLLLLGLVAATALWVAVLKRPTVDVQAALIWPSITALLVQLVAILLGLRWSRWYSLALARLVPGAQAALARTLWFCGAVLVLPLAATMWLLSPSSLPLWAWLWPLALPALTWALVMHALARDRQLGWQMNAVVWGNILLTQSFAQGRLLALPAPVRDPALAVAAVAMLLGAVWLQQRCVHLLTDPWRLPAQANPVHDLSASITRHSVRTGRLPSSGALLLPATSHAHQGLRLLSLLLPAAMGFLLLLLAKQPLLWLFVLIGPVCAGNVPWSSGTAWASPRWPLLPGSPQRPMWVWALWRHALRHHLAPVAATGAWAAAGVALGAWLGGGTHSSIFTTELVAVQALDLLALALAAPTSAVLTLGLAIALQPRRQGLRKLAPVLTWLGAALWPLCVMALCRALAWQPALWELAVVSMVLALSAALGLVRLSTRAWATLDWVHMPQPTAAINPTQAWHRHV